MMSAVANVPVEIFDNESSRSDELLSMARAFLVSDGEAKVAMARAMLALMDT